MRLDSVTRSAFKTEPRIYADVWWHHCTIENKNKCSPLPGIVFVLLFVFFIHQMTGGILTWTRASFFPPQSRCDEHGCGYCSFLSLSLSLCNAFPKKWPLSADASLSHSCSHFWAILRIPIKHKFFLPSQCHCSTKETDTLLALTWILQQTAQIYFLGICKIIPWAGNKGVMIGWTHLFASLVLANASA